MVTAGGQQFSFVYITVSRTLLWYPMGSTSRGGLRGRDRTLLYRRDQKHSQKHILMVTVVTMGQRLNSKTVQTVSSPAPIFSKMIRIVCGETNKLVRDPPGQDSG